jgi:hypothetical protein
MINGSPLVPSLVVHKKGNRAQWLCGKAAAQYRSAGGDRVFSNWKADLFSKDFTAGVSGSVIAAGAFFRWLHKQVSSAGIDVEKSRVKLCLPAFDDVQEATSILGQEMELAGWNNISVSRISEPRANTVGVFSEGRNRLFRSAVGAEVNPYFMRMYPMGSPLLEHLRAYGLTEGVQDIKVVLIDVGSFTSDFSLVDFDAAADGDYIVTTTQTSHKLGIIDAFERPLFHHLSREHGIVGDELTFEEREAIKGVLSVGGRFTVTVPGRRNVTVGTSNDDKVAEATAAALASRLRSVYGTETKGKKIKYLLLTGGGSVAPRVQQAIRKAFKDCGARWIEVEGIESDSHESGPLRCWPNTGESLKRLATALGASSVIVDLPGGMPPRPQPPRVRIVSPWVECSCRGGNKDCVRCAGRGMYRRRVS